jgi:hypothetical protein
MEVLGLGCGAGGDSNCPIAPDDIQMPNLPQTLVLHPIDGNHISVKTPVYDYSYFPPKLLGYRITTYANGGWNPVKPTDFGNFLPVFGDDPVLNITTAYSWGKTLLAGGFRNLASVGIVFSCPYCDIVVTIGGGAYALNKTLTYNGHLVTYDVQIDDPPFSFETPFDPIKIK